MNPEDATEMLVVYLVDTLVQITANRLLDQIDSLA
jgi:hypothetical protein